MPTYNETKLSVESNFLLLGQLKSLEYPIAVLIVFSLDQRRIISLDFIQKSITAAATHPNGFILLGTDDGWLLVYNSSIQLVYEKLVFNNDQETNLHKTNEVFRNRLKKNAEI